jgi:hypothetical protein
MDAGIARRHQQQAYRREYRRQAALPWLNIARQNEILPERHNLGPMNAVCEYCNAKKFQNETNMNCCEKGKVRLENLHPYPNELMQLMSGNTPDARNFKKHIRNYNSAFSFATFKSNNVRLGAGTPTFKICGRTYHRVGNLHPVGNEAPMYNQLYIYQPEEALQARMNRVENQHCRHNVMLTIQNILDNINPICIRLSWKKIIMQLMKVGLWHLCAGADRRRYNLPHHEEAGTPTFKIIN